MIKLSHFVWSANPLTGGNTSGPAKPVPQCSPAMAFHCGGRFRE
ncbi:hypothetical protein RA8CHR_00762 [Variovorax sp. RA8]|nr:hypothetical protein RA8CHR_00762 [Variovorax sp. RA8]